MGLLQKLKSLFGSDQKRQSRGGGSEPDVTVEREPSAESEHAVKGTGGADQQASTQHEGGQTQGQQSEQPRAGQTTDQSTADTGTEETAAGDERTDDEDTSVDAEGPSLEDIKGIGPTYADRLREAGYESVADLAAADAEAVADAAQTGAGRASDWIERAQEF